MRDSMRLAEEGKTFATRLSRCDLVLEHAEFLARFEAKGVPTVSPPPTRILEDSRKLRETIVLEEVHGLARKARDKATLATTPKARERALASALLKIREIGETTGTGQRVAGLDRELKSEIHQITLGGFMEAAAKAEFKGNSKKAIDQYQEALYFIKNDDIDDDQQAAEIRKIEQKLSDLSS